MKQQQNIVKTTTKYLSKKSTISLKQKDIVKKQDIGKTTANSYRTINIKNILLLHVV